MTIGQKPLLGFSLIALLALTACDVTITNWTAREVASNPSNTYTLKAEANLRNAQADRQAAYMTVVVDGERHRMTPSLTSPNAWEWDYRLPSGRNEATYFYELYYELIDRNVRRPRVVTSDLQSLRVLGTTVLQLETTRAPVGTQVVVAGRGFNPTDRVVIGSVIADTEFISPTSLSFRVPPLTAGRDYQVVVRTQSGNREIGPFRVDPTDIVVRPAQLRIPVGTDSMFLISLPNPSSSGGLPITITTDIPDSVALPTVQIDPGMESVNVRIRGLTPGRGNLRIEARGFSPVLVPVFVE